MVDIGYDGPVEQQEGERWSLPHVSCGVPTPVAQFHTELGTDNMFKIYSKSYI